MADYYTSSAIGPDARNRGSHNRGSPEERCTSSHGQKRYVLFFRSPSAPLTRGHAVGTQRQDGSA